MPRGFVSSVVGGPGRRAQKTPPLGPYYLLINAERRSAVGGPAVTFAGQTQYASAASVAFAAPPGIGLASAAFAKLHQHLFGDGF